MDTQAVNSAGNPAVQPPKTQSSSSGAKSNSNSAPAPKPTEDSVDLSSTAQNLQETGKGGQASAGSEQRKFDVTDNNDVVLKVIDPDTQKVVKTVPSEEQIQLRNAIRDGVDEIIQ